MTAARPLAVLLDELATGAFGDDWPVRVAQFAGVNLRTCQRVRQAARSGQDHASAMGLVNALAQATSALLAQLASLNPSRDPR